MIQELLTKLQALKFYVVVFTAGVLAGVGMTCHATHIKKEETVLNATADTATIKKNGDIEITHPRFHFEKLALDKTVSSSVGGLYLGGGTDILHPEKINGAVGMNLGPIFAVGETDLQSIRLNFLFHF